MQATYYEPLWLKLNDLGMYEYVESLKQQSINIITEPKQGDYQHWKKAYENLPGIQVENYLFNKDVITAEGQITAKQQNILVQALKKLHPWRKGPFKLFNSCIDSEWVSSMKWNRLKQHLPSLKDKVILDVGCGNGYYLMRMADYQPKILMGIDPGLLQNIQFWAVEKYLKSKAIVLPLKAEQLPIEMPCFDLVFSMGILYHRKSPIRHLEHMKNLLSPRGTLILETLVIKGDESACLVPASRYAKMRNVWFLPSVKMLVLWLKRLGFKNIQCVSESYTSTIEQRTTEWMKFHSLSDFLDQKTGLTVEGYKPPLRAIITATK